MATHDINKERVFGSVPYGNLTSLKFKLATGASGKLLNANSASTIASGDVVNLGVLPAGMTLEAVELIVKTPMTALSTASIGFKYVDGVNSAELSESAMYFMNAQAVSAGARVRFAGQKLDVLPKAAYLTWTQGGAENVIPSESYVIVSGELTGDR